MNTGKVIQVIGAAVDVQLAPDHLPAIENAIEIDMDGKRHIVAEVAQQIGDGIGRAPTRCRCPRYGFFAKGSGGRSVFGAVTQRTRATARSQRRY